MYAALGKNDQKIYVVPSQNLVVVRFGNAAYTSSLSITVFDEELWQKINDLNCNITSIKKEENSLYSVGPNPFYDYIHVNRNNENFEYCLTDYTGKIIYYGSSIHQQNFSALSSGVYFLKTTEQNKVKILKLVKAK